MARIADGIRPMSINCGAAYVDPTPVSMQCVRILDLATVDINWRMLTIARPSCKMEDDYFTKYLLLLFRPIKQ